MPKAKSKLKNWSSPVSSSNVFDNSNFAQGFSSFDDDRHNAIAVNNTVNGDNANTVNSTVNKANNFLEHKWQDGNKVKNFLSNYVAKDKENKKAKENVKENVKVNVKENVKKKKMKR